MPSQSEPALVEARSTKTSCNPRISGNYPQACPCSFEVSSLCSTPGKHTDHISDETCTSSAFVCNSARTASNCLCVLFSCSFALSAAELSSSKRLEACPVVEIELLSSSRLQQAADKIHCTMLRPALDDLPSGQTCTADVSLIKECQTHSSTALWTSCDALACRQPQGLGTR